MDNCQLSCPLVRYVCGAWIGYTYCMHDHSVVVIIHPIYDERQLPRSVVWRMVWILTSGALFVSGLALSAAPGLLFACSVMLSGCHSTRSCRQQSWRLEVCGDHAGSVNDNKQCSLCVYGQIVCKCKWENLSEYTAGRIVFVNVCINTSDYEGTLTGNKTNLIRQERMTKGLWYGE